MNISQASSSLSQLQTELQSTDQDTTPGGVFFVLFMFFSRQQWSKQQGSLLQEPLPGRTALSSCLPALNSSSNTLPSLLEHPPSHSPGWAHTLLSHCWYATCFSSPRLSAFGARWAWRREYNVLWRQQPDAEAEHSISKKEAMTQDHSLPPRPGLPCSYIIPDSSHIFRPVLSISFPVNAQLCCIFLRNLVEPVGFGVAVTASSV